MILLYAVVLGFAAGFVRARISGRSFRVSPPGKLGLLFAAALLQAMAFYFPGTRKMMPDWLAAISLVGSQICLLAFVGFNRTQPGFLILGVGLALNILVIVVNGGWMPVSPQVVGELFPESSGAALVGERIGWSKDILLLPAETRLWWLSDCFLLPAWLPQRFAFSPGDILIVLGAFWALWVRGGQANGAKDDKQLSKHITIERKVTNNGLNHYQ
jgi:hypothetical protein